jgi:cytochrome bd-type quinol oxidase subunit 2
MNTALAPEASRQRKRALVWLIVSQLVALVSLVPWAILAGFTFVAMDPSTSDPVGVWVARIALWAYPLLPLACSVLAWKAYRHGSPGRAVKFTSVAFVAAVLVIAYVLWATSPV